MKSSFCWAHWLPIAAAALLPVGCNPADEPEFRLNMIAATSNEAGAGYQQEIANVLGGMFGTPDQPLVIPETGLNQTLLNFAAGPAWSDEEGASHGLYRKHCVHCHGISGDGRGPTARFLNPYPRDYRKGVFKFKSTATAAPPTDEDLHRVLWNGIPGTSMPSFSLLPSAELESLIEYVKYLSIRGELETLLMQYVYDELGLTEMEDDKGNDVLDEQGRPKMVRPPLDPARDPEQMEVVMEMLAEVAERWQTAPESVVLPEAAQIPARSRTAEEKAASIAKGRELFYSAQKGNCMQCHGPTALGDGNLADFDVWNKEVNDYLATTQSISQSIAEQADAPPPEDETAEERAERLAELARRRELLAARLEVVDTLLPVRNIIPRNLRAGVYRGGRRELDVFYRIHSGINGANMPAAAALSEAEMWNIVDYVLSLPYEPISGPQNALPVNPRPVVQ